MFQEISDTSIFVFISDEMVYMYKEIAETCCLGVYGLIRPEIDY